MSSLFAQIDLSICVAIVFYFLSVQNSIKKIRKTMTHWPHAPPHILNTEGTYMVTGATYNKEHFFKCPEHLDLLQSMLIELAEKYGWKLIAWAIFSNHYHFIAESPDNPQSLRKFITHLHAASARALNILENYPQRKVWYEFWDSKITFQKSYLARLCYVMNNPVKHQLVNEALHYKWCSARWFKENVSPAYFETVIHLDIDTVAVNDSF